MSEFIPDWAAMVPTISADNSEQLSSNNWVQNYAGEWGQLEKGEFGGGPAPTKLAPDPYGWEMLSQYLGGGSYATNPLLHGPNASAEAWKWFSDASNQIAKPLMDARNSGGFFGGIFGPGGLQEVWNNPAAKFASLAMGAAGAYGGGAGNGGWTAAEGGAGYASGAAADMSMLGDLSQVPWNQELNYVTGGNPYAGPAGMKGSVINAIDSGASWGPNGIEPGWTSGQDLPAGASQKSLTDYISQLWNGGNIRSGAVNTVGSAFGLSPQTLNGINGAMGIGSGLYGLYNQNRLRKAAMEAASKSDPWGSSGGRALADRQLQELMQNPNGAASSDPRFAAMVQAAARANAPMGTDSGAFSIGAQKAGGNWLAMKMAELGGLSGAGINPGTGAQIGLSGMNMANAGAGDALATLGFGVNTLFGGGNNSKAQSPEVQKAIALLMAQGYGR